mmetsp:Transcript_2760/g.3234  ORF Transcript_2760/g.3234 Transcript_2760/m.3234 type:complete len:509 (-) Transcript_2760:929-2455(-)
MLAPSALSHAPRKMFPSNSGIRTRRSFVNFALNSGLQSQSLIQHSRRKSTAAVQCKTTENKKNLNLDDSGNLKKQSENVAENPSENEEGKLNMFKTVGILTGSQFVGNLGFGCVLPVLPIFASQMGLGASGVGLIVSTSAFARLATSIPFGTLSDAGFGRKPLMIGGNVLIAAASISTGVAHTLPALLSSRLLLGIGSSCAMAGSGAYLGDVTKLAPNLRAKIMGFQSTMINSAYVIGPAIGGWLCDLYGARTSFFIVGIAAGLTTIGYTFLPETARRTKLAPWERFLGEPQTASPKPTEEDKTTTLDVYKSLIGNVDQQSIMLMNFALFSSYSSLMTIVPLHVFNIMGDAASASKVGLIFAGGAIVGWIGAPIGGYLADRFGRKKTIIPSALLISTGICAATSGYVNSFETLLPTIMLWGLGNSMVSPGMSAFAADIADDERIRGQALSLSRMAGDSAFLVSPVILGAIAQMTSCTTALYITSLVVLGSNITFGLRATERRVSGKAD